MSGVRGFLNARVIDGLGGVLEWATVLVRDGLISGIETGSAGPSEGAGWLDLGGRTLMPGRIDAHVHLSTYPESLGADLVVVDGDPLAEIGIQRGQPVAGAILDAPNPHTIFTG